MLTILYNVIITPLVYLIEFVYAVLNRFFVNPGLSIVGVSLAVNFLSLPLYRRADLIQEEERAKQASMAKWVDHIKAHFKGDEQYMMLSTYYRQQGYKPTQALRSSLSLLLQIPFFMAAYNYLSSLGDLEGTRFLFINDLSRPDSLITIGGFAINVLPIAMTLLNCAATYVYTKGLPLRDKIQAYGLAAIFLVLLYDSPAGLVFYWTCNQVFSLVKNIFYKMVENPRKVFAILVQVFFAAVVIYLIPSGRLASMRRLIGLVAFMVLVDAFLFLPPILAKRKSAAASEAKDEGPSPTRSFLLAAVLITVILGVLIPSAVIGASPTEFINAFDVQNPLRHVVTTTSILGGLVILWGGVFYYLGNPSFRRAMALVYWVVAGILNGIDQNIWNPETDTFIEDHFSVDDMAGKKEAKRKLQEECGLWQDENAPLVVMIGRLTNQKGLGLVRYAMDRIMSDGVQMIVLGTGDADQEEAFRYFQDRYPGQMCARITFDNALSHRMYAGGDILLMPSEFEPCGLSQMIAMRYGTLPVVRETGGLKDSVEPYNQYTGEGTGFSFANMNADEMADCLLTACWIYRSNKDAWHELQKHGMTTDFSWDRAAVDYLNLFHSLHPEVIPWKKR